MWRLLSILLLTRTSLLCTCSLVPIAVLLRLAPAASRTPPSPTSAPSTTASSTTGPSAGTIASPSTDSTPSAHPPSIAGPSTIETSASTISSGSSCGSVSSCDDVCVTVHLPEWANAKAVEVAHGPQLLPVSIALAVEEEAPAPTHLPTLPPGHVYQTTFDAGLHTALTIRSRPVPELTADTLTQPQLTELEQQLLDYEGALVGQGAFGGVSRALLPCPSQPTGLLLVAVKILNPGPKNAGLWQEGLRMWQARKRCALVTPALFWPASPMGKQVLVMDMALCSLGDVLQACAQGTARLPATSLQHITACLLSALAQLQGTGLIHCDIKPDNILLSGSAAAPLLGDWGCCMDQQNAVKGRPSAPGTPLFQPAEVMAREDREPVMTQHMTHAIDAYAAGVTLLMCAQASAGEELPLEQGLALKQDGAAKEEVWSQVAAGPGMDARLVSLLRDLTSQDPAQRLAAVSGAASHPYFQGTVYAQRLAQGEEGCKHLACMAMPCAEELLGGLSPREMYERHAAAAVEVQL